MKKPPTHKEQMAAAEVDKHALKQASPLGHVRPGVKGTWPHRDTRHIETSFGGRRVMPKHYDE